MIKRIFSLVVLVPVAIVLIVLSVANRQAVTLALNPFDPADSVLSMTAPFFVFLFLALMVGMIVGSLATWFSQGKYRKSARSHKREAVKWHQEADKLKAENQPAKEASGLPALSGPGKV